MSAKTVTDARPRRFGFLLVPEFSMVPFITAVEALRNANRLSGRDLYRWPLLTRGGKPVHASNRMAQIPDGAIEDARDLDALFVCAGMDPHLAGDRQTFAALRRLARHGTDLGSVCTGSYLLARAGLLDGYSCTIHWENLTGFTEAFPHLTVSTELFQIDRDRFTCSGGTAPLDMMLHIIEMQHGHDLAVEVSEQMIHDRIRAPTDHQRMTLRGRLGISHPRLLTAIERMESNLEEPLSLKGLAGEVGISKRQLERLFRQYLDCTPARYYIELRLRRARMLLDQTSMTVTDVGIACGFVSTSHFSRSYRDFFGRSPRMERAILRGTGAPVPEPIMATRLSDPGHA